MITERCPRCNHPASSFCVFDTKIVEYTVYVERSVRWCYPCAYDWKVMFWKQPAGQFKLGDLAPYVAPYIDEGDA